MSLGRKLKWHCNNLVCRNLWLLGRTGGKLSVVNVFGSPGDTLLTGILCRSIKANWPGIKINCVTEQPELLQFDRAIDTFNKPIGAWRLNFDYLDLLAAKDPAMNVLEPVMRKIGINQYIYKCKVYLLDEEIRKAKTLVSELTRPILTFNIMSRETTKVWRLNYWRELIRTLAPRYTLVQLGDSSEPYMDEAISFAGKLSLRESMAVLSQARVHIGPDSFSMHAANGLDVPSVIIFGGSRTDKNAGYAGNVNLYEKMECGPCYLHSSKDEVCEFGVKCMDLITPEMVLRGVESLEKR